MNKRNFKFQELYLSHKHTGYAVKLKVAMLSGLYKRILQITIEIGGIGIRIFTIFTVKKEQQE